MSWTRFDLGVGVIALGSLDQLWDGIEDLVDVVEVEPQTLWETRFGGGKVISPEPLAWLRSCGRPLLAHGVGYPVGGLTAPDPEGVAASAASARDLGAVHWSEHLAFNVAGDAHAGFLLPPVQTPEAVAAAVGHIRAHQDANDRPFLVETPTNYLQPVPGDLTDGDYVAAIAEGADCGILLDLHNIWTNERNGRQSVDEFLSRIPLERVWEVHLAGGFETDGYYLDAHVGPIDPELLALAARVVPTLPRVRAVIYEAVPASLAEQGVAGLCDVLEGMHRIVELPVAVAPVAPVAPAGPVAAAAVPSPDRPGPRGTAEREAELVAYTTRASDVLSPPDPGAVLMRALTDEARLSLLVRTHPDVLARLLTVLGRERTSAVLTEFLTASPASLWTDEQGDAFAAWLAGRADLTTALTAYDR
ncbi:hypothetical protein GCM10009868_33490 [Terrabacter aerolatus]|uniref:Uncharacterized protein n=1 Tax=Terrabacter aerolatus TaxID=422442 RepID=A0A512CWU1_9MICO|nr:DUF692 family multinuclear iron-containing protein [Terrabacter aerolatus]GEO28667.1 hypothetical protein TAE01_04770 [Terrabacter aerolatus]